MANVKWTFRDSRRREISRTIVNEKVLLADILTDVGTLAALWNPLTDLELLGVSITFTSEASAFAGAAVSNRDENVSVRVEANDGRVYDFDLPDVPDAVIPTEFLDITLAAVTAFFAEFAVGGPWRINLNNPTYITEIISGTLDK